jgi:hypothetical protein
MRDELLELVYRRTGIEVDALRDEVRTRRGREKITRSFAADARVALEIVRQLVELVRVGQQPRFGRSVPRPTCAGAAHAAI